MSGQDHMASRDLSHADGGTRAEGGAEPFKGTDFVLIGMRGHAIDTAANIAYWMDREKSDALGHHIAEIVRSYDALAPMIAALCARSGIARAA